MKKSLPSRSALIAFEAAARHQSFTSAAAELTLTESAISRQVAALESQLGIKLFHRIKKRVTLTKAGLLYSQQVRASLLQMEQDMNNIMSHGGAREILELAVLPTFCSRWLIPRIGSFYQQYPDITINMSARSVIFLFKETSFDAAIHFGQPNWPGTVADFLFSEEVVAVCKPDLIPSGFLTNPEDIQNYALLHLTSRPDSWCNWCENAQISSVNSMQGAHYEYFSILISAACAGLGVALIPRFLIADELEKKQLIIASNVPMKSTDGYYLVYPEDSLSSNSVKKFRMWLLNQ
ncbi:LysR substrate-binding domain-containing protein [uncultured Desulfuromusa sp.]|uniref:LysR substrate-binding domain-containing protein n=1 Tax=uncultured Desulfuromusa sp. TaxID=219183 RepID=UPI002AA7FCAA|nr:LysR substrate-binding domain-containing protein [uncultured Desulfuromusa sp.]